MGGSGAVCGALSGAIAALGVYVGRTEPDDIEGKNKCIALSVSSQIGIAFFLALFGTV